MRSLRQSAMSPSEVGDFADEVRRVFMELDRTVGTDAMAGECSPPIDAYETVGSVEIVVDLPGVDATTVRVVAKGEGVLIVGEKAPRPWRVLVPLGGARLRLLCAYRASEPRLRHGESVPAWSRANCTSRSAEDWRAPRL